MKSIKVVFLFVLLFALSGFSQQRWERTYGDVGDDIGYSVQQTQDGGYIITGWTRAVGNFSQVYLIKTDAFGDTLWTRTYGGPRGDAGNSVQMTRDEGYIIVGGTDSFGDSYQVYLVKTNSSGDTLWTRAYGGPGTDVGEEVVQTQDGGYIVVGHTTSFWDRWQIYLLRIDASGNAEWGRSFGGTRDEYGYSVQPTQDGGFIVAGSTVSFGNIWKVYLIKTNGQGDTLWTRTYGGTGSEYGYSVKPTQEGGYVFTGQSSSFGNGEQVYLVKTNGQGDTLWTRTYGGANSERGNCVCQTSDGGYIVAGSTVSFGNSNQVYLIKTNGQGDTIWTRIYGGLDQDVGYSVQQTQDGGFIVAGYTRSFGAGGYDVYLIKTDANGNVRVDEEQSDPRCRIQDAGLKIHPNPFVTFASVLGHEREDFAVYDIAGSRVGIFRGDGIGVGLAAGVYFVKSQGGLAAPQRIVKIR